MENIQTSYTGSIAAISAVIVMLIAKFGFNVQASDISTVIFGIIALVGIIKQMRNTSTAIGKANRVIGSMR